MMIRTVGAAAAAAVTGLVVTSGTASASVDMVGRYDEPQLAQVVPSSDSTPAARFGDPMTAINLSEGLFSAPSTQ
jgi:hypothetical protein